MPSGVSVRRVLYKPALLTSTSSLSCEALNSLARRRTSACAARSASKRETLLLPDSLRISWSAPSPFSRLRPVTTTSAPIPASAFAAALPMPEVPPVIKTTLPFIPLAFSKALPLLLLQANSRRSTPAPSLHRYRCQEFSIGPRMLAARKLAHNFSALLCRKLRKLEATPTLAKRLQQYENLLASVLSVG